MSTAAIVGGDYYDFFLDESQNLKFVIADATGHGLSRDYGYGCQNSFCIYQG